MALGSGERRRLALLSMALPMVSLCLWLLGYKRTLRLVDGLSRNPHPRIAGDADLQGAERLARLAAIAGRWGPIKASCLRQSLLVYGLLRRRGFQPELKLGVRRERRGISAHAWVDLQGNALAQPRLIHTPFANPAASP